MEVRRRDRGEDGTLRLEFLNDRLMAAWFFPDNPAAYAIPLQEVPQSDSATKLRRGKDHRGKDYLIWEDERLRQEFFDWIKKYS